MRRCGEDQVERSHSTARAWAVRGNGALMVALPNNGMAADGASRRSLTGGSLDAMESTVSDPVEALILTSRMDRSWGQGRTPK
jgi:hypothetical protein